MALKDFDLNKAVGLSIDIHRFEVNGGRISEDTDKLWDQLTAKIEAVQEGTNVSQTE